MIRVLLCDDQALLRGAFAASIGATEGMEVIGQAGDGAEAVRLASELRADVVLMGVRMPELDGVEATARIGATPGCEDVHVLVLTTYETEEVIVMALGAGASGFLGKGVEPPELLAAIRTVAAGESLLSPAATRAVIGHVVAGPSATATGRVGDLTEREKEILALVGTGLSNEEIAERLVISPLTAKTHVNRVMTKLGAHDRAQLVIAA